MALLTWPEMSPAILFTFLHFFYSLKNLDIHVYRCQYTSIGREGGNESMFEDIVFGAKTRLTCDDHITQTEYSYLFKGPMDFVEKAELKSKRKALK